MPGPSRGLTVRMSATPLLYLSSFVLDAVLIVVIGFDQLVGESLQSGDFFFLLVDGAIEILVFLD